MSGLAVKVGADTSGFDAAMKQIVASAGQTGALVAAKMAASAAGIDRAFANSARNAGMSFGRGILSGLSPATTALAGVAAGAAAVYAAYATVTAAIDQANAQLDRFVKLGASAEKAGVSVEAYQRISDALKDSKLSAEQMDAAIQHAATATRPKFEQDDPIRKQLTDIFETGYTGSFQSKGLADYIGAKDAEERVRAVVTAMQELRDLGLSLGSVDLAEKVFGSDVADRIRSGRLDIEAMAEALDRKREDIISAEQVAQAEEFRDRLDAAYQAIDQALHVSVALEGAGRGVLNVWLGIAEATAQAATSAGTLLDRMLAAARAGNQQSPLAPRQTLPGEGSLGADLGFDAGVNARGQTLYPEPIGPERPKGMIEDPPAPPRRPLSFFTEKERTPSAGRGAKAPAAETIDQVQGFVNSVERSTEALKAEVNAIGQSEAARLSSINTAKLEAIARQQGIAVTDEQIAKVKELSQATAEYKEKLQDARDQQEAIRSIGGDVLKGIASDARSGASAIQILTNAFSRLLEKLEDKALDSLADSLFGKSGGTSGGLLGAILGGGGGATKSSAGFGDILGFLAGTVSPIPTFAEGAVLRGPGTGTSDSMVARVSTGEAIIPARAVAAHRPVVEALIMGRLPGFAEGRLPDPGAFSAALGAAGERAVAAVPAPAAQVSEEAQKAVGEGVAPVTVHGDTNHYSFPQPGATPEMIVQAINRNNEARDRTIQARLMNNQRRYPG